MFPYLLNSTNLHFHPNCIIKTTFSTTKKKPIRINEFSKVTGYKINIKKLITFLYTNNELTEREIKKKAHFIIAPEIIKCHQKE